MSDSNSSFPPLSESDFAPAEWSKISSLCSEYVRLQSQKSDIESDMKSTKEAVEELIRSILEIPSDSPLPVISSSNWKAKPGSRTTTAINRDLLIEQGVEIEVIESATESDTTYFLQIEDPNKRKGKGKKSQAVSNELMNIFGSES